MRLSIPVFSTPTQKETNPDDDVNNPGRTPRGPAADQWRTLMDLHMRVTAVTQVAFGSETTADLSATDTLIPLGDSGDFSEDGGYVSISSNVYAYSVFDDGEESGTPSITLDTGLVADVDAETPVFACDETGAVVYEWKVSVTDDLDGSSAVATLSHSLIPLLPAGMPVAGGDSVTVTIDEDGDWWVTEVIGKRPYMQGSIATGADDEPRVEIGEGSTFNLPAEEVRFYTENVNEDAPAEITSFVSLTPFDGDYGVLAVRGPEWDTPVPTPPQLTLSSGSSGGARPSQALLFGQNVILDAATGAVTLQSPVGVDATMRTGSVGTGTFRDSVDARVTAVATTVAQPRIVTGTTGTAVGTNAKTATISGYTPAAGDLLALTVTNGNTATAPTLNINSGGAVAITAASVSPTFDTAAGAIWFLYYTGSAWVLTGNPDQLSNYAAHKLSSGQGVYHRDSISGSALLVSQRSVVVFFTAEKIFTAANIKTVTAGTAGSGATTCKVGVHRVESDGSLTLLGKSTNDTALWSTANTAYTKALDATFATVRGQEYGIEFLFDGTTPPSLIGQSLGNGSVYNTNPRLVGEYASQTDISSTRTAPSGTATLRPWASLLP